MQVLLDTCDFLWFASRDARLPVSKRAALEEESCELYLSVVSLWEILLKHRIGKLPLPEEPRVFVRQRCAQYQIVLLSLRPRAVNRFAEVPLLHSDPFDRMLVAVALEYGLTLCSCDPEVRKYSVPIL